MIKYEDEEENKQVALDFDLTKDVEISINGEFNIIPLQNLNQSSLKIDNLSKLLNSQEMYFTSNDLVFLIHSSYVPHWYAALDMCNSFMDNPKATDQMKLHLTIERDILGSAFGVLLHSWDLRLA